ncbi:MAG: nicotinamide riboside transporter PnuC [Firmicutes bacterium]|nr:nicotinamide riboside transporter PnuC [Bacillota bacterium]
MIAKAITRKQLERIENTIIVFVSIASIAGMVLSFVLVSSGVMDRVIMPVLACVCSITGILCSVYIARFKIIGQYLAAIHILLFGFSCFWFGWYGMAAYFLLVRTPLAIGAIFKWSKTPNLNAALSKQLSKKGWLIVCGTTLAATVLVTGVLYLINFYFGDTLISSTYTAIASVTGSIVLAAIIESLNITLAFAAAVLSMYMYRDNWLIWKIVNILLIVTWGVSIGFMGEAAYSAIVLIIMSFGHLANNFTGNYRWKKHL